MSLSWHSLLLQADQDRAHHPTAALRVSISFRRDRAALAELDMGFYWLVVATLVACQVTGATEVATTNPAIHPFRTRSTVSIQKLCVGQLFCVGLALQLHQRFLATNGRR